MGGHIEMNIESTNMAKKARTKAGQKTDAGTQKTEDTEESSVYDAFLSTCCCNGSSDDQNSLKERQKNKQPQHQQQEQRDDFDQPPKLWERITDVALFLIGGAPPVKIVKCFECHSVDGSELTVPRVLTDMAEEYEQGNLAKLSSMWGISESITEDEELVDVDAGAPGLRMQRTTSSRWNKLRLKSSSSSGMIEDSYTGKRRMRRGGSNLSYQASGSKKGGRQGGLGRIRGSWSRAGSDRRHRSQDSVRSALVEV